tara:strand:+ start:963 stop:1064 length:102 start_codon:yes stop_codon:yes gene_type:complete
MNPHFSIENGQVFSGFLAKIIIGHTILPLDWEL